MASHKDVAEQLEHAFLNSVALPAVIGSNTELHVTGEDGTGKSSGEMGNKKSP